jgi:glycosyltransferase involved in cell wall biosynthesis
MKKILFFTHHLSQGGAEKTVRMISEYINSQCTDMKSYVCVVYDDPDVHRTMQNVIVLKHRSEPGDNRFRKAFNVLRQIREVKQIKKKLNIDVCVSFLPGADIINVFSAVGETEYVAVRSRESLFVHNIWKKIYVKTSYRKCDRIIAVSDVVRHDVISYFGVDEGKVQTIHNAVVQTESDDYIVSDEHTIGDVHASSDVSVMNVGKATDMQEFAQGRRIVINVGRLSKEKGQIHLIRAFYKVASDMQDACLCIIGEGDEKARLEKAIDHYHLNDKVMLAGFRKNAYDYMKQADIFVLSSVIEGMPNVLLEAMQNGLPVISTECGAREILAPGTDVMYRTAEADIAQYGILVPLCAENIDDVIDLNDGLSPQELIMAENIEKMLNDKELSDGYRNRNAECLESYSVENIMKQWIDILK